MLARGVSSAVSVAVGGRVVGLRVDELFPALGVTYAARLIDDERGEPVSAPQAEALRRLSLAGPMSVDALGLLDDDLESLARRRLVFLS